MALVFDRAESPPVFDVAMASRLSAHTSCLPGTDLATLRPRLRPAYLVDLGTGLSSATASAWV